MKIWVALPAYGRVNVSDTTASLFELGVTLGANGLFGGFGTASHTSISDLRNTFLTIFYDKTNATHILMVDADMGFSARMIIDMLEFNKPLVGVVAPRKGDQKGFVGKALPGEQKPENGFLELAGCGAGILLVRRDCVDRMIEAYPDLIDTQPAERQRARQQFESAGLHRVFRPFDETADETGLHLSEDLSFCYRWRAIGGQVWANVSHNISHIGMAQSVGNYQSYLQSVKVS